ncbi:uncharacterized protein EKO05_0008442 [Ascochyta rabiei]|uniref:Uncharacterized protein n=1 Tax=Didymella rabiei TaxID=5454 RepID=A0A163A3U1_DIDRA|nr:uncharacterized protein EKO05_0008442 [Ascochyta rabiei]KZM20967.1 hypothetical protein ST47_g7902 [Ascochyta rabiei]UPX18127.1 hypothetical protein EKO05_0008442 [Ascochyta rabiei]
MRYVRFLKPPRITTDKGATKSHVFCLVTITSDLGDSFFPHHVELAAELVSPERGGEMCVWRTVQWAAGMRSLAISLPLKKSYASRALRVRVGVEPKAQSDALHDLSHPDAHGIVSAWSADFNSPPNAGGAKLVQRRFTIGQAVVSVWEETGESIARHLWDAGITLAHHLSSLLPDSTHALSTALLPSPPNGTLNVLELGTGCGIVGITLASLLPNCTVTLTDLPEAHDIVSANLSLSHSTLAPGSLVSFAELDWDAPLPPWLAESESKLDMVLAADCTYNPDSSPALVRTLTALTRTSPHTVVAIALKLRHESERVFFSLMADAGFLETAVLRYDLPGDMQSGEERVDVHVYRFRG